MSTKINRRPESVGTRTVCSVLCTVSCMTEQNDEVRTLLWQLTESNTHSPVSSQSTDNRERLITITLLK